MNSKKWLKTWFIFIIIPIFSIGFINFIIDPMWSFGHKNIFNEKQLHFNERQQKTNNVYFNGLDKFDGIMFGSSRTTFINQNDFIDMNIYNYAIDSMQAFEYVDYLEFAKRTKKKDFKYIIIGADFYNTNDPIKKELRFKIPKHYIATTISTLYRYKMLFSKDVLAKSRENIKINILDSNMYYLRNNIKVRDKVSEKDRFNSYTKNIIRHTSLFHKDKYSWNDKYFPMLKKMKNDNPNTKFIIFTSPITADLFVSILKNTNKSEEYKRWIKGLVDIFGEIYCFMGVNSITTNLENYPDDDHYYPYIGKILANKISTKNFSLSPSDFGTIVNSNNIDDFLNVEFSKIKSYKFSKDYPVKEIEKTFSK